MKSWIAIPVLGLVAASIAALLGTTFGEALCAGAAAAAIVHALRSLAGDSPAALVGAGAGALLAVVSMAHRGMGPYLALAAAAWTFAELARPQAKPVVALAPATIAAILEPGCAALIAIAGTRLMADPRRWMIAVPLAGAIVVVVAIVAGAANDGAFASLGHRWYGVTAARPATSPGMSLALLGDALGPLAATAALGGLVVLARVHLASLAIVACATGALLVDLRAGRPGAITIGLAAVCAGAAIGRLAGMIRLRNGQAIAGATCGAMLLLPPLWSALATLWHG